MGKLLLGLEIVEGDLSPDRLQTWTLQDLENFYLIGSRACMEVDGTQECLLERARFLTTRLQEGDVTLTAIWKEMRAVSLNAIGSIVDLLGCHFDLYKGESDSHIAVESMLSGFASNDELIDDAGSKLVATGTGEELLLLKSGTGSVLYAATDLATIKERVDAFAPNKIIYCVDQRQDQHFKSVFSAAHRHDMAGNAALIHAGFGTVKGHDGKPFKTRDGGTVKLHELLDHATQAVRRRMHSADDDDIRKVAIGALKFADLQSDRTKGYVFDLEAMCSFEGCTGPYLQYACVRISSLLAKAGDFKMELRPDAISAEEKAALLIMLNWPNVVDRAATDLKPHYIGEHVFRLAQAFSRVYAKEPILDAEDTGVRVSRLSFCSLLMGQLTQGLHLLGIEVPQKM